jgi:GAF domain-containing protein
MSSGPTETPGLTEKLGQARTLDEALEAMVLALRPEFSISWATIRVVDPNTPEAMVLAGLWAARETTLERGMRMSVLATSLLEVSEAGGTVIFGKVRTDRPPTLLEEILRAEGARSWVSIPLRVNGRTVGLLSFSSSRTDAFSESDRLVFDALGSAYGGILLELARREIGPDQRDDVD